MLSENFRFLSSKIKCNQAAVTEIPQNDNHLMTLEMNWQGCRKD